MRRNTPILILILLIQFSCDTGKKPPDIYVRVNDTLIVQKRFHKNGTLEAEISKNNDSVRHGSAKLYYENGRLSLSYNNFYGNREGLVRSYYKNGSLHYTGKYSNNLEDSTWTWYYEDGKVEIISNWVDGKENGYEKGYYPNGSLKYIGKHNLGVQDSAWVWYKEDGTIDQIEYWENGKVVSVK